MAPAAEIFVGVGLVFFALAKGSARPGFNAFALGVCLAATPWFSHRLPGRGDTRDVGTVALLLAAASAGTALGGGLRPQEDAHDHNHAH
ncbi:MAG: hypothetical protein JO250_19495 [Armatimonadetes bacterium]|nr:hypothetical protein [Armatimonadota bacterium]